MPDLYFGVGAYRREHGDLPELRLVNMWVEQTKASEKGYVLQSRPGLLEGETLGSGPIRGIFQKGGVFGGDTFVVSGDELYRAGDLIGEINGPGPVSFAASQVELVIAAGFDAWSYKADGLEQIAFPDDASVRATAFAAGLFLFLRADMHRYYWSAVLDGRSVDGLDYASAESSPDELLDIAPVGDEVWLLGSETVEPWQASGDPDAPFIRSQGRLYRKGVIATGCARELDNSLFWIGNDRQVYRGADVPQRLSDHGIEERLAASSTFSAFRFLYQGHAFFCVRVDAGTWAYNVATGEWCEFASYGLPNWRIGAAADIDGEPLFGDAEDGRLWSFSGQVDAGGPFERRWTGAVPLNGPEIVKALRLNVNVGQTQFLAGDYAEPVIEVRASTDAGRTFEDWRDMPLGRQGEYRTRVEERRFGMFDDPGAYFDFRCTDPVSLRVSAIEVNPRGGGRAR